MQIQKAAQQDPAIEGQGMYTFEREEGMWHVHYPRYPERGWDRRDLRMAEGAHKFLNALSNGVKKLRLQISVQPQENAGKLELVEHCKDSSAVYLFTPATGQSSDALCWICDFALFVFGDMPDSIYVQRLPLKENSG